MELTVDSSRLNLAIREFQKVTGRRLPEVFRDEGKLFLTEFINLMPPKNRAQGRNRVKKDIGKAVRPLSPNSINDINGKPSRLRELVRKKDYATLQLIADRSKSPALKGYKIVPFTPGLHKNIRDRRGRVLRQQRVATPDYLAHKRYTRRIQTHVGIAKKGWAKPATKLGAKIPRWVARAQGARGKGGRYIEQKTSNRFSITLINNANKNPDMPRLAKTVLEIRAKRIERKILFTVKQTAKTLGFKTR